MIRVIIGRQVVQIMGRMPPKKEEHQFERTDPFWWFISEAFAWMILLCYAGISETNTNSSPVEKTIFFCFLALPVGILVAYLVVNDLRWLKWRQKQTVGR